MIQNDLEHFGNITAQLMHQLFELLVNECVFSPVLTLRIL